MDEIKTNDVVDVAENVAINSPDRGTTLLGVGLTVAAITAVTVFVAKVVIPGCKKLFTKKEEEANSTPEPIEVDFTNKDENA